MTGTGPRIRVLIVDDSAVIRSLLSKILASDPAIEVVATAPDPFVARDKLLALSPDVMTLDIEMPKMDGLTFLGKVMQYLPVRTLVLSSLTSKDSELALKAWELGAIDVVAKPAFDVSKNLEEMGRALIAAVKTAAKARLRPPSVALPAAVKAAPRALAQTTHQVLAIASSTGGTEALKVVLSALPQDAPGIVIVQHMPPVFTKAYAQTLDRLLPFAVKEAEDGDRVLPGQVLLAPGNYHMELARNGAYYVIRLHQQPTLHGVRPAADYLLNSVAKHAGSNATGMILTGMGKDGAAGLLAMKEAGSYNFAQDDASCVVFGMPKAAIELGAVHEVLSLQRLGDGLRRHFARVAAASA